MDFGEYEQFILKKFDSWTLFLHRAQYPYLGRSYAWSNRDEANIVENMNSSEREELFNLVLPEWGNAVNKLSPYDRTNLSCFGNTPPHLHWHLIPRSNNPRIWNGLTFDDPNPRGNYVPHPKRKFSLDLLLEIKEEMISALKG